MTEVRVGTSGFSFDDWVGTVYPRSLPKTRMLEYYEQALGFDTVELNFTYYSMPETWGRYPTFGSVKDIPQHAISGTQYAGEDSAER